MKTNIINYFGQTNGAYIHARGAEATAVLSTLINCKGKEKILEIGFGTGSTILLLSKLYKNADFYGIERSKTMYQSAINRLRFSRSKKRLRLLEDKKNLPYSDSFFDKIYLESVLGIQEDNDLKQLLKEIKRVLKPNGTLIFNETIWLDHINLTTARQINDYCKNTYGIIQANETYLHVSDWLDLLNTMRFQSIKIIKVDQAIADYSLKNHTSPPMLLSVLYNKIGKLNILLSPQLRKQRRFYQRETTEFTSQYSNSMEGVFFIVKNTKS